MNRLRKYAQRHGVPWNRESAALLAVGIAWIVLYALGVVPGFMPYWR